MDYSGKGLPLIRSLESITKENESIKTFIVSSEGLNPLPGQFFMVWLPNIDEKPISVCIIDEKSKKLGLTIKSIGSFTESVHNCKIGEKIGLRGPFGNGFSLIPSKAQKKHVILLAGGIGIAPIRSLFDYFVNEKRNLTLIYGAHTSEELIFRDHFNNCCDSCQYCTDDGSYGYKGFPTDILKDYLQKNNCTYDNTVIYSCGPELFLKAVLQVVHNFDVNILQNTQLSLADRYMRCGVGLCGSCIIDDKGLSVCKDGPVFSGDLLSKTSDFGNFGRLADGSKNKL